MGELIKDYTRKQRKYNDRLNEVETKLFGKPRDPKNKKKVAPTNVNKENSVLNTSVQARKQTSVKKSPIQ